MTDKLLQILIFAQETGAPAAEAVDAAQKQDPANPWVNMLPIVALIALFYFIMIRPQRAEQRKHQELVNNLKKNDQVQTIGGIIGTVTHLTDDVVTIKVDDNAKIKMRRSSIQTVLNVSGEET